GRLLSLHEEEPSLSRDGQMHEGAVSAELGLAGWPSVAEAAMVERDITLAAYEQRVLHIMHVSALESVHAIQAAHSRGVGVTRSGRLLSLHEEEPSLSRDGQMHEGAVSAELGLAGWPSVAEAAMVERDITLAAYEQRVLHIMHVSALESVHAIQAAHSRGVGVT